MRARHQFLTFFCLLAALFSVSVPSFAATNIAQWPIFRGDPQLSGVSHDRIPDKPALLWTFKTQGPIQSSAVVGLGQVFIGSDDNCVYAIDLASGKEVWHYKTEGTVESPPLLVSNTVIAGSEDNYVYALSASTGKELWKFKTEGKIVGSPNVVESKEGPRILAGSYDFKLYCIDASTGKPVWNYASSNFINGTPAVSAGQTAFGGCDMVLHIISLTNGMQVSQCNVDAPIAASPALLDGRAYVGHYENRMLCVDIKTGSTIWSFKESSQPYFSSPAVTSNRVIFGGDDRAVHCVNRADGKTVWTFKTRGKVVSSRSSRRTKSPSAPTTGGST